MTASGWLPAFSSPTSRRPRFWWSSRPRRLIVLVTEQASNQISLALPFNPSLPDNSPGWPTSPAWRAPLAASASRLGLGVGREHFTTIFESHNSSALGGYESILALLYLTAEVGGGDESPYSVRKKMSTAIPTLTATASHPVEERLSDVERTPSEHTVRGQDEKRAPPAEAVQFQDGGVTRIEALCTFPTLGVADSRSRLRQRVGNLGAVDLHRAHRVRLLAIPVDYICL